MNTLEAQIEKIIGISKCEYGYIVKVSINCWGSVSETVLLKQTLEAAQKVKVGDKLMV